MTTNEKRLDVSAEPLPIEMFAKPAPELTDEIEFTSSAVAIHEIGAHLGEDVRRALLSAPEPYAGTEDQQYIADRVVYDSATGCWLWTKALSSHGYGSAWHGGRSRQAHRVAFELYRGPIPEGLHLDHLCEVTACCNPWHLEPVTQTVNIRRGKRSDSTHCSRGHLWAEHEYVHPDGRRYCRACKAEAQRRRRRGEVIQPKRTGDSACRRGHALTPENTYVNPDGVVKCRICLRGNASRRRAGYRAAVIAYRTARFRALGLGPDGEPIEEVTS